MVNCMQMNIKNVNVNYTFYDNKSKTNLIFLHGWGQNIEMMMSLAKPFSKKYNVLIIDLPGFGNSDEPKEVWDIYDYVDMVDYFCKELKIKEPTIIGHSFGGKVALGYASKYKPSRIVSLAGPYRISKPKQTLQGKILKLMKKVPVVNKLEGFAKKHMGSTDYKNASETMRKILVKHINHDITDDVKKIKCPVLLIWGTNDTAVPYEDAINLENIIPNCGLVTYEGCTHYAYLERLSQTISVLKNFIGDDKQ